MARALRLLDNESGIVEVSSRTLQGRYLLRPSEEVNRIVLGVIGRAQAKFLVEIYAFVFLSNHFHLLMRALSAMHMADFTGFVKGNIAKELGPLHDWEEKFWGKRYHSALLSDSEQVQEARFKYILSNGCKEGLVASPLDWPGVTTTRALYRGETTLQGIWYDRTAQYRAARRGKRELFPSVETVRLTPLPFLAGLSPEQQQKYMINAVREVEQETREQHKANGTKPLGVRDILRRHPHDKPKAFQSSPAPLFFTATREEFWRMREARSEKVAAYRIAAERLRRGELDVRFPEGSFPPPAPFVKTRSPPRAPP